ncbi:N-acetylgalactosamine kinase [Trichinella zimbabwensis]|uniref:N-acetylgalactosamine kinase n=1 Tax=Trichinella zimbabwensis TaxID=268475 RepID=A0A0V1HAN6_9BILA|nr:N-acetylgalactosamine kinase [Trichinella zimbabwensis]KRZ07490.1 N-acetylgalactosamine kinase [Trichinella zimbabwensis]
MIDATNDISQFSALLQAFRNRYKCEPEYVVKSPGRINIIGEHIDYSGYPVLPMAINECIYAACSLKKDSETITISNIDPQYEEFEETLSHVIISCNDPCWKDYFLSGVQATVGHVFDSEEEEDANATVKLTLRGFNAMISSELPARAGLASSSALVCCGAACTMVAVGDGNFSTLSKEGLADLCAISERSVGVFGGSMDHFICFTARQGAAKYIQFNPIRLEDVTLPPKARFMVFNCGLESAKGSENSMFNKRVTECHLATKLIANIFRLDWRRMHTIKDVQDAVGDIDENMFKEIALSAFTQVSYTVAEIANILQCDESELKFLFYQRYSTREQFCLKMRARHVIEESMRVKQFRSICDQFANGQLAEDLCLNQLGKLMDDSHHSCSYFFDCSCKELDFIQQMFKVHGAIGSRLTGAGWGGAVIALIDADRAETFQESVVRYIEGSVFRNNKPFFVSPGECLQIFTLPHNLNVSYRSSFSSS